MNVLFICSMARMRSKTANNIYTGISDYAGTDNDADKPITKDLMEWADKVVCMEMCHRSRLRRKFKGFSHKMLVLGIPDEYNYMDSRLIDILNSKLYRVF